MVTLSQTFNYYCIIIKTLLHCLEVRALGWLRISDSVVMTFVRLLVALCFLGTVNVVWLNNDITTVLIMILFK